MGPQHASFSEPKALIEEVLRASDADRYYLAAQHLGYNSNASSDSLARLQAEVEMPRKKLREFSRTGDRFLIDQIHYRWTPSELTLGGRNARDTLLRILDSRFALGILAASLCHDSIDTDEIAARIESWKRQIIEITTLVENTAQFELDSEAFQHLLLQEELLSPIITEILDEIGRIFETLMPAIKLYWGNALNCAMYGLFYKAEGNHA